MLWNPERRLVARISRLHYRKNYLILGREIRNKYQFVCRSVLFYLYNNIILGLESPIYIHS